jgi:hypothetical protein
MVSGIAGMSHLAQITQRVAGLLVVLAVLVMGLGVWGQVQQTKLDHARAEAMMLDGPAAFDSVAVPFILIPFEMDIIPGFISGDRGTVFGVFARIGGALGVLGIILFSLRAVSIPAVRPADDDDPQEAEPPTMKAVQAAPTADWQHRLATKMAAKSDPRGSASRPGSPDSAGRSLARIVAAIGAFCALVLGAAWLMMQDGALPDPGLLLDQTIMTLRAALAGDRDALFAVIRIVAPICGGLVLLRLVFTPRKARARRDGMALH